MSTTICGEQKIITRVFVRRVFVATSGDFKSRHKVCGEKTSFCDENFRHKSPLPLWCQRSTPGYSEGVGAGGSPAKEALNRKYSQETL